MKTKNFFLLILFLIFIGCKKEKETEIITCFPLKVNNQWEYTLQREIKNIDNQEDSILLSKFNKLIIQNILVSVIKKDNIENVDIYQISCKGWGGTYYYYYTNDIDGLKFAYFGDTGTLNDFRFFPKIYMKSFSYCPFYPHNKSNNNITSDTENKINLTLNNDNNNSETILKNPITLGDSWTRNSIPKVNKTIIGKEFITIENRIYDCYKIQYKFDNDSTSSIVDFISEQGLVKREKIVKKARLFYNRNTDSYAKCYADFYETWLLINYTLQD